MQCQNVEISNFDLPNEPSIMMDPNNTDILVAGSNTDHYYTSSDSGKTWSVNKLESSYVVWGDPVIVVDTSSNFYFFHLSYPSRDQWIDRIVCQKSSDNGQTWTDGSYTGLNGTKNQDKPWSVIDRNNNNIYVTWTQFDKYNSADPLDITIILFSKSLDGGITWSDPLRINKFEGNCIDGDDAVEGAVPAVGPNGEIYVSWAGPKGLVFNRSLDYGNTWLEEEILINTMPGGWDFKIPGISRCNGLPVVKCDLSGGPNNGTIYVNWSDQSNGVDNTDIWLTKSIDKGETWSTPAMVNNDNSIKHQFFTWMDIDQTNGNLHFVFYDRRNYSDTQTDVYLAHSIDGGENIVNRRISESPFVPNEGIFFGDYNNIAVHNNIVRPIWTRLHEGQLSIWTDVSAFDSSLKVVEENWMEQRVKQYPNPIVNNISYVSFKLRESSIISLAIYDQMGKKICIVMDKEEMGFGKHVIPIDLDKLSLKPGIYYHKLSINSKSKALKAIVVQ